MGGGNSAVPLLPQREGEPAYSFQLPVLLRRHVLAGIFSPGSLSKGSPMAALTKEATDRFAEVNGIKIHYNEAGSGPTLICTHGGGPGANAWDNTRWAFDKLAEHFHVILMDLPGFGESQKLVKRNGVPMDHFMAGLELGLMDQLRIDRAHLYNSSAFSASAVRFGIEYPDRVGKVVVQSWSPAEG